MNPSSPLLVERTGAIARLTLNRPEKRNALNDALVSAILRALREVDADDSVRVVTLAGAGPDFCAGADLEALRRIADADVLENLRDVDQLAELLLAPRRMGKPVVALVHGRALAGGCGLASACDLVLAAESATFGYPEIRIGFVPAMVMAILRRSLGEKRAFEMIAGGDSYSAAEAERVGLVNRVFDDRSFHHDAERYVASLAERSASAMMLAKRLFYHQDGMEIGTAVRAGADLNVLARMTADTRGGVDRFLARDSGTTGSGG